MPSEIREEASTGAEIAIIGMDGRFPGANNIEEFWDNLEKGIESIWFFSEAELVETGLGAGTAGKPHYIPARGILEDLDYFDASFFNLIPGEVKFMDPQMRIFHECAWKALEDAGYDPGTYPGLIGLYTGAASGFTWEVYCLLSVPGEGVDPFTASHFRRKDHLATRVSYKLNLKGPSFTMATACSSSLVAINLACQGILSGECDMALAGGVSVFLPQKRGYMYGKGMIYSVDGHNRAFDTAAGGTVFGNGIGLVVLKLLEQAREDGDHIYAVIKGFATNNDGSRKTGYTAPSVDGQAEVIRAALHMAEIPAESVSYVETHGTATELGDTVEIEALKVAFATEEKQFCAIGSVKTNFGHLDIAAGVAGLVKTVLAMKHRLIPPTLFYETPNPKIDFENSPFYVNRQLSPWQPRSGYPRRAGVSSFGIGGTNAHVILEECPKGTRGLAPLFNRQHQLILLSAKTAPALEQITQNLVEYLKKNPGLDVGDAAYTLQMGRAAFARRKMTVCSTSEESAAALSSRNSDLVHTYTAKEERKSLIFMFPGQGAQYTDMGRELYEKIPYFRQEMDLCFEILKPLLNFDIKEIIYRSDQSDQSDRSDRSDILINQTEIAQPVLFIFEYALAKLLMHWGIKPYAMIGHSVGEYVAASLAGVFSLEDALNLVFHRGRLMQQMPPGAMLGISLPENQLNPLLVEVDELDLAAVNGPSSWVLAGPRDTIDIFKRKLEEKKIKYRPLHTSHAFHSKMMEPVITKFQEHVEKTKLNKPGIPFISNVTGRWITVEQAVSPQYWAMQLRSTVKFSPGIKEILKTASNSIWLEIGPGNVLSTLVKQHRDSQTQEKNPSNLEIVNLVRHPQENFPDFYYLLTRLGQLWLYGAAIDWASFHSWEKSRGKKNYRISLPTYPFEKQYYPIPANPLQKGIEKVSPGTGKNPDISQWFYIPSWKRTKLAQSESAAGEVKYNWLVFVRDEHCALGAELVKRLEKDNHHVVTVGIGTVYTRSPGDRYFINPGNRDDYQRLFQDLRTRNWTPHKILHMWNAAEDKGTGLTGEEVEALLYTGFYSLLYISQALKGQVFLPSLPIDIVTHQLHEVVGGERLSPARAAVLGPLKVMMQENPNLLCRSIDIEPPDWKNPGIETLLRQLLAEITGNLPGTNADTNTGTIIAYRNNRRWVQTFEPFKLNKQEPGLPRLREKGVYLITGGLGNIGLLMAEHLVKCARARLVLVSRKALPVKKQWQQWLSTHGPGDSTARKIRKVSELEKQGGEVRVLSADTADIQQMQEVIAQAQKRFGPVNGVIHAAGVFAQRPSSLISEIDETRCKEQFLPKIYGTMVLEKVLSGQNLDFCLLMSSISSVLGGLGLIAYSAANNFLDAFASRMNRQSQFPWISVNWDAWAFNGNKTELAINPQEGLEAFKRILSWKDAEQVIVSTRDLQVRINQWVKGESLQKTAKDTSPGEIEVPQATRPDGLLDPYLAPATPTEKVLIAVWEKFFGIKPIGIRDEFFALGGDSLKAVTLIAEIHKALNVNISLSEFFNRQTLEKIAAYVENNLDKDIYASIEPGEEKDYYPLSPSQQRLFFLQQMDPQSTVYNIYQIIPLEFEFDREKLEWILKKLVERHESFRTSFQMRGGELGQGIHEGVDFGIENFDIHHFIRPFDLSRAPLLRVGLMELQHTPPAHRGRPSGISPTPTALRSHPSQEGTSILMVDMHHIISDGVSLDIFLKDFFILYRGEELPALRIQYRDYSEWKHRQGEKVTAREEKFWINAFAGEIPLLKLPGDYGRPAVQSYEGKTIHFEIGPAQTEALKKLVLKEEVTLFMLIISIYYVLLLKLSGQEDIVVATPVAGRKHPDLHYIIGNFLNTLALRNYPTGEQSFTAFLKKVKQGTLDAFENQDYPFENLVNRLQVNRDLSRNPLFDTMFIFHNERDLPKNTREETSHSKTGLPTFEKGTAQFDLTLVGFEMGNHLYFRFEYCTKLFKEETIRRFINYFNEIVLSVLENPDQELSRIEIIPREEKNQVLYEFNNTGAAYPQDKTLHELFREQVEQTPDHVALLCSEGTRGLAPLPTPISIITYQELNERADRLARHLRSKGAKPGTIAAIMVDRTIHLMVGLLGILKTGAAYLPLDPEYPEARIKYIIEKSGTHTLVTQKNIIDRYKKDDKDIVFKGEMIDILAGLNSEIPGEERDKGERKVSSLDPAYVIYTSGSTGSPKGVVIGHQNVVNFITGMAVVIDFSPGQAILALTTISFDIFFLETLLPLTRGLKVVIAGEGQQKDPALLEQLILKSQLNMAQLTPSRLQLLLSLRGNLQGLAGVGVLMVGGEAFPSLLLEKVKEHFPGKIYNMYGPTETTIWSAVKELTHTLPEEITIGTPIANTQVYIVDKNMYLQPLGVPGELLIGGEGVALGYLNNPGLTHEKFIINRSYRSYRTYIKLYQTGDLARWLSTGEIEFLGRRDHQVKIRGFRIELEEIEEQLLKLERIKEAVVVLKTSSSAQKYLCAYMAPHPGDSSDLPDTTVLREKLSVKLPPYMIPAYFVYMEKMPLTPNGKIDRKALPEPDRSGSNPGTPATFVAPATDNEKTIARLWKEILHLEKVGIYENFFDLGGNSMNLVQLNWKLKEILGIDMPVALMFRNLTIEFLSKHLDQEKIKVQNREKQVTALDRAQDTLKDTLSKLIIE